MSVTPKYRQVYQDLRDKIEKGVLAPGDQLPSGADLCASYQCSATVINTAAVLLVEAGYIVGAPGTGRFVADKKVS